MNFFLHGFADELVKCSSVIGGMAAKAIPDAIDKAKANRPYRTVDKIPADAQRAPKGSPTVFQHNQKVRKWKRLKAFASKGGVSVQMPPYPGSWEATRKKLSPPRLAGTKR